MKGGCGLFQSTDSPLCGLCLKMWVPRHGVKGLRRADIHRVHSLCQAPLLTALCLFICSILTHNLMRRDYCHCHLLGKETESQSRLPKTTHLVAELGNEPDDHGISRYPNTRLPRWSFRILLTAVHKTLKNYNEIPLQALC